MCREPPCCTGTRGVEVMAIKFGVNLATPNPLHHHLYLPPTPAAAGILCGMLDSAGRFRVWLLSLNLRTHTVCIPGQLSPHRVLFRLCLLHHVSDFGRLENFKVRQSAWSLCPKALHTIACLRMVKIPSPCPCFVQNQQHIRFLATQKTNISSSLFTMCREWHAALLRILSLSCWLGLSTLGPYGPLGSRVPPLWGYLAE